MTQTQIILQVLEDRRFWENEDRWVVSWKIIKNDTPYGFLGTSADREARRMAESKILERTRIGKFTYYRIKQEQKDPWQEMFKQHALNA